MLCVRDSGRPAKFHRAGVAKMRARMKHMAKEKVGTSSTNTPEVYKREVYFKPGASAAEYSARSAGEINSAAEKTALLTIK